MGINSAPGVSPAWWIALVAEARGGQIALGGTAGRRNGGTARRPGDWRGDCEAARQRANEGASAGSGAVSCRENEVRGSAGEAKSHARAGRAVSTWAAGWGLEYGAGVCW